jgi:predicted TIM-barrel fold metal-dependent hydrolase
MIIDSHTHIGRNEHINSSAEDLLRSMDSCGIDKALVFAGKLNDAPNEYMLEQIKPHKDRLFGVAACHPADMDWQAAADQLFELIDNRQVVAVKFYLGYDHWYPDDRKIRTVLQSLQMQNMPAIFHTGDCLASIQNAKLKYAHPLGIDEVAVDYPDLKIVMAHMAYPWQREAAEVCYKNKNVYADMSGFVYGDFNAKEVRHFHKVVEEFTTIAGGTDKLLFGTDFPISNQKSYIDTVSDMIGMKAVSENIHKVFNLR